MNLITLVSVILLIAGLSDWLTERVPRLQRDIYYVVFFVVFILFTSKLYYGPDIKNYVPFYAALENWRILLSGNVDMPYEWGFCMFCSVLKGWGVSFWGMTALISVIYFYAIWLLLSELESKRSFALMCIVILDATLITVALRQCLSVAFFILMIVAWKRKHYVPSIVCMLLACMMHKSGLLAVMFPIGFILVKNVNWSGYTYWQLLMVLLTFVLLIPVARLTAPILAHIPLPEEFASSAAHHLQLGRQIQTVFALYMVVLVCLAHYTHNKLTKMEEYGIVVIVGMCIVVALYQYFYLLNRIRSFFVPFVVVYVLRLIESKRGDKEISHAELIKQLAGVFVYLYMIFLTVHFYVGAKHISVPLYASSTIFELREANESQIRNRQMKIADTYWRVDFMKKENNRL